MFVFSNSAVQVTSDVFERPVALLVSEVDGVKYFEAKKDSHATREIAFAGTNMGKQAYKWIRKASIKTLKKIKESKCESACGQGNSRAQEHNQLLCHRAKAQKCQGVSLFVFRHLEFTCLASTINEQCEQVLNGHSLF